MKEFCAQEKIATATFHKWQSRRKQTGSSPERGLTPVVVSAVRDRSLFAEVSGIRIFQPVTPEFLKALVS